MFLPTSTVDTTPQGRSRALHPPKRREQTNKWRVDTHSDEVLSRKQRFLEENVKASRLRPSSSSTSSGTFIIHDTKVCPRLPSMNDNTIKDHSPLPRQDAADGARGKNYPQRHILADSSLRWRYMEDRYQSAVLGLYKWVVERYIAAPRPSSDLSNDMTMGDAVAHSYLRSSTNIPISRIIQSIMALCPAILPRSASISMPLPVK
jgi:hypothetical protein